jgi:hypothetical protein
MIIKISKIKCKKRTEKLNTTEHRSCGIELKGEHIKIVFIE